jgi:hypothetical protein
MQFSNICSHDSFIIVNSNNVVNVFNKNKKFEQLKILT